MASASPFIFYVGNTPYDFRNVVTALPDASNPNRVVVTFNNGQTPLNLDAATYQALHLVALNATGNPPTGSAGGDLTGAYPNPTIATVAGVVPSSLGLTLLAEPSAAQARLDLGITPASIPTVVPLTDAATIAVDASLGSVFTVTLGGNRTLGNPTNPNNEQRITIQFTQDATGSRTLAFGTKFAGTTTNPLPTISTAANKIDWIGFRYVQATDKWYVELVNLGGA